MGVNTMIRLWRLENGSMGVNTMIKAMEAGE